MKQQGDLNGSAAGTDVQQYMFTTVKVMRGRENATKVKYQNTGWELVEQTQGTLRSELTFRKPKPHGPGFYLAKAYAWFQGLDPSRQKTFAGIAIVLFLLAVSPALFGGDDEAKKVNADPTRSAEPSPSQSRAESNNPYPTTTESAAEEPSPSTTATAPAYSYKGPAYEVVLDEKLLAAPKVPQYWVMPKKPLDIESKGYKQQVKLILTDLAHEKGTTVFVAQVVAIREIAEAEGITTWKKFVNEHGADYAINTIPKLEVEGWVASYTGGLNPDTLKPTDNPDAYEIIWRPYAASELETWKPELPQAE